MVCDLLCCAIYGLPCCGGASQAWVPGLRNHTSGGLLYCLLAETPAKFIRVLLQEFYKTFYLPSNARFWMWGDGPEEEDRLRLLDSYLAQVEPAAVDSEILPQPLYKVCTVSASAMQTG